MKRFLLCAFLITLSSCASMPSPEGKPLADITFAHLKPLSLDVQTVNFENLANANAYPEDFYVAVPDLFEDYVARRFQAKGTSERDFRLTLENLDITYTQENSENSFANMIGVARTDKYSVEMQVNLSVSNPQTGALKGRRLSVKRVMNISEHVSLAEREQEQMTGVEAMFADLDQAITDVLINDFGLQF